MKQLSAFSCAIFAGVCCAAEIDEGLVLRHALVGRRAAAESMVLLKNEASALPLAPGSKVALFGDFKTYYAGGGGSSNVKPVRIVDVPAGLAEAGFEIDPASRETAVFAVTRRASEGRDSPAEAFELSEAEKAALAEVEKLGFKRIVAVCNAAHAINLKPLAEDPAVGAIVWMWCPGGEGGAALGDVLSGKTSPSGRLASTFASSLAAYPSHAKFRESRWYEPYEEDIFVGYRYFETVPGAKESVVYPFGHGLGYSSFEVRPAAFSAEGDTVSVKAAVSNTGPAAARHSVLCYVSLEGGAAEHPAIELRAFAKTRLLQPGESEELSLSFPKSDLAFFDDEGASGHPGAWVIDSGRYTVKLGGSVRETVVAGAFEVPAPVVVSRPGFKLQPAALARRLRKDGSFSASPLAYPGPKGLESKKGARKDEIAKPEWLLRDVAEGKVSMDAFLDQMTLREMLHLLYGHPKQDPSGTGSIGDFEKFGIPAAQTCDGPAGVRRAAASTYFPCAALLASSFDPALLEEIGSVIGAEAAETGFDILLAPGLCIHRHPLCGRNFEYFSEDPLVAGVSAGSYVRGVQSRGIGATLKHFAGNNRETTRRIELDVASERAFREIYLAGFKRAIEIGRPWAIMTSYNGVNGFNAGANHGLMTGILRDEWGYEGLTMTDWHTTVPVWREIEAGNDLKMPSCFSRTVDGVLSDAGAIDEAVLAYDRSYLSAAAVRRSARRVCELVMKTRRFRAPPAPPEPPAKPMLTPWGEKVTSENCHRCYPRPQMVRKNWTCLNGDWDWAATPIVDAVRPAAWNGKIRVPFAFEAPLSGCGGRLLKPDEYLWYTRKIELDPKPGERILLHFGAVDFRAIVYLGHQEAAIHEGGQLPFTVDLTPFAQKGENTLTVLVWDPTEDFVQSRGKQAFKTHSCFYTRSSGIVQTVWLETVPDVHISGYTASTDIDRGEAAFTFRVEGLPYGSAEEGRVAVDCGDETVEAAFRPGEPCTVRLPAPVKLWSPEEPNLYNFTATFGKDEVTGYIGMRKFERRRDAKGVWRFFLNNEPYYVIGTLDQGWWPDGLLTPPSEEAMAFDIQTLKDCGFNTMRKHIKVEALVYYSLCDKMGLLVLQDMPCSAASAGGPQNPETVKGYALYRQELAGMIDLLENVPSIVMWIPYNEGWGQHDRTLTHTTLDWVKRRDPSRLVGGPSGWQDFEGGQLYLKQADGRRKRVETAHLPAGECEAGDTVDYHYYRGPAMPPVNDRRISFLGEFGGLGHPVEGHLWSASAQGRAALGSSAAASWGYGGIEDTKTREGLEKAYLDLMDRLSPMAAKGLAGSIYTQTTDVEIEINGLLTYDRRVLKFDPAVLRAAHEKVRRAAK